MDTANTIGAFVAKTHLSELLERVERGEVMTITRRGRPIARLVPIETATQDRAAQAVARLRALRHGATLGGLDWRELRDTGRC
ncbi:MAG TPA: type II toxin-antitoxin system prevent-host-death family antitoxin [Acetobacteraceae bacterium]|nr:type II toxin-antitoxin system prevent-host-death family antitoxin [Acetobacteraceae bacterium]